MKLIALLLVWLLLLPVLALWAPLPIPSYQDFSVLYFSDAALLNAIPLYDYPTQLDWVRAQTRPDFEFHPYPYPPWYALVTLPVAFLPIEAAARLWFLLNLTMIAVSVWLLTPHWKVSARWFSILLAALFIPAFGLLVVGQYSAPVLLGAALFVWAAQRQSPWGLAISLVLMTFKPHIGLFLVLAGFGWLTLQRKHPFARQAIGLTVALGLLLIAIGFLADTRWPLTYLASLLRYREIPGVQTCGLCASLPIGLMRLLTGQTNTAQAAIVSIVLGAGLLGFVLWQFGSKLTAPRLLMCLAILFTLLVDPYLLNYDYILLLLPLIILTQQVRAPFARLGLLIAYLLPWLALAFGRQGNPVLALSALLVLVLLWHSEHAKSKSQEGV
ncbi:MAG: hypothetical protein DDG60_12365 [Anaerolineae bacterium]|nr:MAG: hypothetical protein DDG60_12365 [Anaerolineae bacterium]